MESDYSQSFSLICGELCNLLYEKEHNKSKINQLVDELNGLPYRYGLFVHKHDASALVTALYVNIKSTDLYLVAKVSHLMNSILTKQNLQFGLDYLEKVASWHILSLKKSSDIIMPDLLHNLQRLLQLNPELAIQFSAELIGTYGILINLIDIDKHVMVSPQNQQIYLAALKSIICCVNTEDCNISNDAISTDLKEKISQMVVKLLLKGYSKSQDEFLYCKVVISALRVLSQLYFNDPKVSIPMTEVMGICRYFILYGLVNQEIRPEKIMPAQQTVAAVKINPKGGKKQRLRKQRNNAIESLKKEIPMSDRSLMRDVGNFENNSAYKPASKNYLEPQEAKTCWTLTSDSDMSDLESSKEAKLIALKSRVRQSSSNLLLVIIKMTEKKEMFGYWWALFPDSPDDDKWYVDEVAKKTLAYCVIIDPIATSRASVLSVMLALLSGSKVYLSQAENSKKDVTSFIPFSVSLGYMITCMHKVLVKILDSERSHAVIIVALKCCAALVQATPYHKLQDGLISELVRTTRKFLVHREVTLQVGSLIVMGCVLSVDPKVEEVLKAIDKNVISSTYSSKVADEECDDFEEGYSDDESFEENLKIECEQDNIEHSDFKSWVLNVCLKNMGWMFRGNDVTRCKPSAIPVILESLQVLSAIAFHHFSELLVNHLALLTDILKEILQHEHQEVVLHAARTVSIIGDALQKLELTDQPPSLPQCVNMWAELLPPLSKVLQSYGNSSAKAAACDCIANVGEKSFKELPRRLQIICCTLLFGSCSDEEAMVRAAAVRALAMAVMFRTLREDICFVSDCGENVLRALAEPSLMVRTKAAWALGNLSDALVLNMEEPDLECIHDDLLVRLMEVSVHCAGDNDKVKMSAMRGLGNFLRLIKNDHIQSNPQMKTLCETAIGKLLDCACKVTNMKVRWNACYAMGNAMKNEHLFTCFNGWQRQVFPSLCTLTKECKNLKVRINAAVALRAPTTRALYGEHFAGVWSGIMVAMENAANVDDFTEYKHKENLIEQLCVTLAHLCCVSTVADLADILDPLVFHYECAKNLFTQLCHKLPPENTSCLKILQAAKYVTIDLTAQNDTHSQSLTMLQNMFIWDM